MIQYYVRNPYEPMFTGENHPRLRYFGEINADEDKSPRVMHAHDDFVEVLLLREGTCTYLIGSRLYKVSAGDLIVYNSGVLHDESVWAENGVSTYCLAIDGLSLPGLRKNALLPDDIPPVFHCGAISHELETLYELIRQSLGTGCQSLETYSQLLAEAFLTRILPLLGNAAEPVAEAESVLGERIKAYLDLHYAEDIGMPEIAEALRVSAPYLTHVFKSMCGYSPMKYLLRRRIGEAQTLLLTTNLPISEIGARVGYETTSYFSAQFTKHVGVSPKAYRKKIEPAQPGS